MKPLTQIYRDAKKSLLNKVMKHWQGLPRLQNPRSPPQRILVVDDDDALRQLSVELLTHSGYEVAAVADGSAGWEALQAGKYDLLITDNKMPKMTGVEMIEKLHAAHMAVPVIMATGYLPMDEFGRRPWLKPDVMLEHPYGSGDLLEAVKKVLGGAERKSGESPLNAIEA